MRPTATEVDLVDELAVRALLRIKGEHALPREIVARVNAQGDLSSRLTPELRLVQNGKARITR